MRTQAEMLADICNCPKCGAECCRDEIDVCGWIVCGSWGCPACGWSEDAEYDLSDGHSPLNEADDPA